MAQWFLSTANPTAEDSSLNDMMLTVRSGLSVTTFWPQTNEGSRDSESRTAFTAAGVAATPPLALLAELVESESVTPPFVPPLPVGSE